MTVPEPVTGTSYAIGSVRWVWVVTPNLDAYRAVFGPVPLHALDPELWGDQA